MTSQPTINRNCTKYKNAIKLSNNCDRALHWIWFIHMARRIDSLPGKEITVWCSTLSHWYSHILSTFFIQIQSYDSLSRREWILLKNTCQAHSFRFVRMLTNRRQITRSDSKEKHTPTNRIKDASISTVSNSIFQLKLPSWFHKVVFSSSRFTTFIDRKPGNCASIQLKMFRKLLPMQRKITFMQTLWLNSKDFEKKYSWKTNYQSIESCKRNYRSYDD